MAAGSSDFPFNIEICAFFRAGIVIEVVEDYFWIILFVGWAMSNWIVLFFRKLEDGR